MITRDSPFCSFESMKVSIIIPVYNVAPYIEACLRSVMRQTYKGGMECLIVDDCGTDDSIGIVEYMIAEYDGPIQFKILHHEHNRGLSAARNTGIDAASGDYILFVDSDDEISPDCIEKLIAPILRDRTIEMVIGDYEIHAVNSLLAVPQKKQNLGGDYPTNEEVRYCFFDKKGISNYAWNRLVKKNFLSRFCITFQENLLWEDDLWLFYIMKYLNHVYIINDVTYFYYVRPNSITTATENKFKRHCWGVIYYDISSNLTVDDSYREVRYYVRGFWKAYISVPKSELQLYIKTSRNFRNMLSVKRSPVEWLLLFSIDNLVKTKLGWVTLCFMRKMYHTIR